MEKVPNEARDFYKHCMDVAKLGGTGAGLFAVSVGLQQIADAIDAISDAVREATSAYSEERGRREEDTASLGRLSESVREAVNVYDNSTDP